MTVNRVDISHEELKSLAIAHVQKTHPNFQTDDIKLNFRWGLVNQDDIFVSVETKDYEEVVNSTPESVWVRFWKKFGFY